jgi:acetyltransferase-like isoleucine patch superfamily enzyme/multidrug transporter EmrE-like cation transporter
MRLRGRDVLILAGFPCFIAFGQILFKLSAAHAAGKALWPAVEAVSTQPVFFGAVAVYVVGTAAWLWILSRYSLTVAYPFAACALVAVPLLEELFFGTRLGGSYWAGLGLIVAGVILVTRSSVTESTAHDSSPGFLRRKLQGTSAATVAYLQWEALVLWVVDGLPGIPGMAVRTAAYKLLFGRLGGFAWVQPRVVFVHTNRLTVGTHFGVNSNTYINAIGGIRIGNHVLVGTNVTISSGRHPIEGAEPPVFARPSEPFPIVIEDDVWIGAGAVIMPGVTLARGTVVGANSVVTRSTEPYSVVAGAPARTLRSRLGKQ